MNGTVQHRVEEAINWLESHSTQRDRENLTRFGIDAPKAFGVSMANIQVLARQLGHSHELAAALWETGWYEARMLASFVDEPSLVTPEQMERWCSDFDNWGICDTLCFVLFDRTPHAWDKVGQWSSRDEEFVKRAAFALLASLAGHDQQAGDEPFLRSLPLIECAAGDERNFVKKGVSWALRRIGRRSAVLHAASIALAQHLAASQNPAARWIGKDGLRDLTKSAVIARLNLGVKPRVAKGKRP